MENILSKAKTIDISVSAGRLSIAASIAVVICLTALHIRPKDLRAMATG